MWAFVSGGGKERAGPFFGRARDRDPLLQETESNRFFATAKQMLNRSSMLI